MIYLNGEFIEAGPFIHTADRGFTLGDGVFETLLVRNGVPVFLDKHLDRLWRAFDAVSLCPPVSRNDLLVAIQTLIQKHDTSHQDYTLRITVTRGITDRGLIFSEMMPSAPTLMITLSNYSSSSEPWGFIISRYVRAHATLSVRHKTLGYLDNIMARNEAAKQQHQEAVMLNAAGYVACGSISNIFMMDKAGALHTPRLDDGALPGITRGHILDLANSADINVYERALKPEELQFGAENTAMVFFTNSVIGVQQAAMFEAPELFSTLKARYDQAVIDDVSVFLQRNPVIPSGY